MPDYSFIQSEADTILFSCIIIMLYCEILAIRVGPLSLTQIHIIMAAAPISQKLPGLLCIKRKQETILCCNLVHEEMADCN